MSEQYGAKAVPKTVDIKPLAPALAPPIPTSLPADATPPLVLDSDDAAWFKLFSLLEKYGKPGMLEEAFAKPPEEGAALGVNNKGQESSLEDSSEDENVKRAEIITNLVDQPWIDEEVLEKKVLPYLKENSQEVDSAGASGPRDFDCGMDIEKPDTYVYKDDASALLELKEDTTKKYTDL